MDDDASPGVPEWVVTYGDMMSLLLTFFIMLVSLSEIVADKKYRAVIESIQKYIGYRSVPLAPHGQNFPLNSLIARLETLGSFTHEKHAYGGVRTPGPVGKDLRVFHTSQGEASLVGDRIPFASGSARLTPASRKQLEEIARILAGKPNKIEIVGHVSTDPLPANADARDKTLLSYLRARAVFLYLKNRGVDTVRIRLQAAGDTIPLVANRGLVIGRDDRVEVYMVDKFADHFQGGPETASLKEPLPNRDKEQFAKGKSVRRITRSDASSQRPSPPRRQAPVRR